MTAAADIGLASQLIDLATGLAWLHELRDADGRWTRTPGDKPGKEGTPDRYKVPPHERLINPRADYPDPADMPYFVKHPVSAAEIVRAYDAVPAAMKPDGMQWYYRAHLLAKALAHGNAEEGAILLANYSPQANWPINMFRAAEVAETGKPIPKGHGYITGDQVSKAQRALDGEHIDQVFVSPKTRSFAHLIAQGDNSPDDPYGHVVIDAHALNVATPGDIRGATYQSDEKRKGIAKEDLPPIGSDVRAYEYVADKYREAASIIAHRDHIALSPHQLQAVTWVAQVMANQELDRQEMQRAQGGVLGRAKGRLSGRAKDWKRWLAYAKAHNFQLVPGVSSLADDGSSVAGVLMLAQVAELLGDDSLAVQLAAWEHELRGRHGEWEAAVGKAAREIWPSDAEKVYQYQRAQRLADRARQKPPSLHEQITAKPAPETMATAQRLKAALDSGEVSSRYPWETETGEGLQHFNPPGKNDFGNTFDTKIIKFADGSEWIRKRGVAKVDIDKSIAYARIAKVFGVETPEPVRRNTPEGIELWEPKINGMPAIQWSGGYDPDEVRQYQDDVSEGWGEEDDPPVLHPVNGHDPELLMNSEAGNRLGLVDTITNATDRHMGNWMVAGDRPVPIDSESADYGIFPFSDSPFALRLDMHTMLATLPPGQQQKWADDLEAQRPAFAALHHQDWLDNVIENYRALTKAAA